MLLPPFFAPNLPQTLPTNAMVVQMYSDRILLKNKSVQLPKKSINVKSNVFLEMIGLYNDKSPYKKGKPPRRFIKNRRGGNMYL